MACSTGLCFSASIPPLPASCSSGSSRFLTIKRVSSAPSLSRWTIQYKQLGHTLYRRSHVLAFASADAPKGKRSSEAPSSRSDQWGIGNDRTDCWIGSGSSDRKGHLRAESSQQFLIIAAAKEQFFILKCEMLKSLRTLFFLLPNH
ncbi:unnamed protein product [Miscanthus lutarioriparius]|uniref:Uncharacterized protein n=1 Tax=Miscanthus lutarioriparius TaxID=422564 RepID=A0A811PM73_9POAL|nr:unnamed protein product [Miscanthus lutarioriparius]